LWKNKKNVAKFPLPLGSDDNKIFQKRNPLFHKFAQEHFGLTRLDVLFIGATRPRYNQIEKNPRLEVLFRSSF